MPMVPSIARAAREAAAKLGAARCSIQTRCSLETLEGRRMLDGLPNGGEPTDFGDAPNSYLTTLAVNGARHFATNNLRLGAAVDAEPDGQPAVGALRDDLTGVPDDEDGIVFLDPVVPGGTTRVQVTNGGGQGRLNAWLDFNINGVFGAADQIFTNVFLPAASVSILTFATPATAAPGDSYARFRLNQNGMIGPAGAGGFGEVEDYAVRIEQVSGDLLDFGDAPDSYRTLLATNGPRHNATPNILLGNNIDVEPNGQPSVGATRDDTTGVPDDEDGVVFLGPVIPGANVPVQVTTGAGGGRLNAWLDFNLNGVFGAGEQIFINQPVPGASVTVLNFLVPATATPGDSYARFRLNAAGGLAPFGPGGFGEVEDYAVKIEGGTTASLDYGDAPDTYRTTLAVNGARHTATPNLHLGEFVDVEPNGQPAVGALRDDLSGVPDDEDGIVFLDPVTPGTNVRVQVENGAGAGRLNAWLDFNLDGTFGAGEQIFTNVALPAASTTIQIFAVPATAVIGDSYARFRLNNTGGLTPFGFGGFGEVEDYLVKVQQDRQDFGDAPDAVGTPFSYPTMLGGASGNPARHTIVTNGPRFGLLIDLEPDGQQNVNANGDDLNTSDDEDGITVGGAPFENHVLQPGAVSAIEIHNPGPNGAINAWFDWNRDGDWNDPGEQVATNVLHPGAGVLILNVPVPNTVPNNVQIYSRFRINLTGGLAPTGPAANGEVEDYVNRTAPPPANVDFGDAPQAATGGFLYPTTLAVNGARHIIAPNGPRLGPAIDPEPDGQPSVLANGDDLLAIDDEDGVRAGGIAFENVPLVPGSNVAIQIFNPGPVGRLNAWFDWSQNGTWGAGEQPLVNVVAPPGVSIHNVAVPAGLPTNSFIYSRFRINTAGGLGTTGLAQDGEVEDYRNRVLVDTVPPRITGAVVEFETFQGVTVTFTEPIDPASVSPGDLSALNLDDGSTPVANSVLLSANNTVATWVFNTPGTSISDGDYQFDLAAGSVDDEAGNGLAGSMSLSGPAVYFFAGDADRNRMVDLTDFNMMVANFGLAGKMFSEGNFDYDALGKVDLTDFNMLAANFGLAPAPDSGEAPPTPFGDTTIGGKDDDDDSLSDLLA